MTDEVMRTYSTGRDVAEAYAVRRGDLGSCAVCGEPVIDSGHFWEGHVLVEWRRPGGPAHLVLHPGCLYPEVVVVTAPRDGMTIPNVEVGRLRAFNPGKDGWWLVLEDTVSGYQSCSINWDRVEYVERRYDPRGFPPKRR